MTLLTKIITISSLMAGMMLTAGMSVKGQGTLTVSCEAGSAKVVLPADLCPVFAMQVARYSGREIVVGKDKAEVTLVVTRFGSSMISAYIRHDAKAGLEQAMARKDAPLDEKAFAQFFFDLLENSPAISGLKASP